MADHHLIYAGLESELEGAAVSAFFSVRLFLLIRVFCTRILFPAFLPWVQSAVWGICLVFGGQ